jgi:3-methyladenine DNA glycosylase/8-oxoguanine DNA glycosylase
MNALSLNKKKSMILEPVAPYNFDANFHKPSHFPSSDGEWQKGTCWMTMCWKGEQLGLKIENKGPTSKPKIKLSIYSQKKLSNEYLEVLIPEIRHRFNFDSDISEFYEKFRDDKFLSQVIERWRGEKPLAYNSFYEIVMVFFVLQNATVRRSVQMLENLFNKFGRKVQFDGKILSAYWTPEEMAKATEQELRDLKVGYRAKFFLKFSHQFANKEIDEFALRKLPQEEVRERALELYGIGPASIDYLLFEYFYFYDALDTIPPWEQKIMSRLLFNKTLVPAAKILKFFKTRYVGWEKLAFHYLWEDLFWRRKHGEKIPWLDKEIRL